MKTNILKISIFALMLSFVFVSCTKEEAVKQDNDMATLQNGDIVPGEYIVVLNQSSFKSLATVKKSFICVKNLFSWLRISLISTV